MIRAAAVNLDWYQNPTASGRYINHFSNHPMNQKFNTTILYNNEKQSHTYLWWTVLGTKFEKFDIFLNIGYPEKSLKKNNFRTEYSDGPTGCGNILGTKYKNLPSIRGFRDYVIGGFRSLEGITISNYNTLTVKKMFIKKKDRT